MTSPADVMQKLGYAPLVAPPVTTEEAQRQVLSTVEAKPDPAAEKKLRMREERYTFDFNFKAKNGKVYAGTFTSIIPSGKTRQAIAIMRAQLGGGMPVAALDPVDRERFFVLAHLTFMLSPAGLPKWAESLEAILDPDVLYALWEEVQAHEATFFGPG